jgi:hypothetical protein
MNKVKAWCVKDSQGNLNPGTCEKIRKDAVKICHYMNKHGVGGRSCKVVEVEIVEVNNE